MKKEYIVFFSLYRVFLEIDALQSLIKGRNRELLELFYINFTNMVFEKKDDKKLKDLVSLMKSYSKLEKIEIFNNFTFDDHLENRLNSDIKNALTLFYQAISLYTEHKKNLTNEELEIVTKRQIDDFLNRIISNEIDLTITPKRYGILYQALIEFNNALSHIFNALIKRQPTNNFKRAISHFHRGALDILKTIIKDLILLQKINVEDIFEYRKIEYFYIGNEETKRTTIIQNYLKIIRDLNSTTNRL